MGNALQEPEPATALVIIPTYNERENIVALIPALLNDPRFDVLVVDDNSPDGTALVVEEMADTYPGRVFLLRRPGKLGLGGAYIAGFRWALLQSYDLICQMDADFSHDPADLPRLVDASRTADLVLGSRYVGGGRTVDWSPARQAISRAGSLYAQTILGLPYRDLTGGFKCFRRRVLETIDLGAVNSTGYVFQIEMTYRAHLAGFKITEIPIVFRERRCGESKMTGRIVMEAVFRVGQLRWIGERRQPLAQQSRVP